MFSLSEMPKQSVTGAQPGSAFVCVCICVCALEKCGLWSDGLMTSLENPSNWPAISEECQEQG